MNFLINFFFRYKKFDDPVLPVFEPESAVLHIKNDVEEIIKCSQCGSSNILYDSDTFHLVCQDCRTSWDKELFEESLDKSIEDLDSIVFTHRSLVIEQDDSVVTVKCDSCGAEVVINTDENIQIRCHWCRNFLTIDSKIQNGAIPDAVIPFSVEKNDAVESIENFVKKRSFFARTEFKEDFEAENVVGVFLPFFVFDGNVAMSLLGEGEVQVSRYVVKDKKGNSTTYYDANIYRIYRGFNMTVDDLFIGSKLEYSDLQSDERTNNIIYSILPYDAKKAIKYNPNYLRGFTSERRNINIDSLDDQVKNMLLTVGREKAKDTIAAYDRGVNWTNERVEVKGARWVTIYLPVWLYSYYDEKKDITHYVAINGQNKKIMGSIPVNKTKLLISSILFSLLGITATAILLFS